MAVTLQRPSGHLRSQKLRVRAAGSFFLRARFTCARQGDSTAIVTKSSIGHAAYRVWLIPMSSVPYVVMLASLPSPPPAAHPPSTAANAARARILAGHLHLICMAVPCVSLTTVGLAYGRVVPLPDAGGTDKAGKVEQKEAGGRWGRPPVGKVEGGQCPSGMSIASGMCGMNPAEVGAGEQRGKSQRGK